MRVFIRVYTPRSEYTDSHSYVVASYQGGLSPRLGSLSVNITELTLKEARPLIQEISIGGMIKRNPIFNEYLNIFQQSIHERGLDKIEFEEINNEEQNYMDDENRAKCGIESSNDDKEKETEGGSELQRKLKAKDSSYRFGIVGKDDQFPKLVGKSQEEVPINNVFNPVLHDLALIPKIFIQSSERHIEQKDLPSSHKEYDEDDIIYGAINKRPINDE